MMFASKCFYNYLRVLSVFGGFMVAFTVNIILMSTVYVGGAATFRGCSFMCLILIGQLRDSCFYVHVSCSFTLSLMQDVH